jgi:flagellar L-ring protein precursor FlgH
MHRNSFNPTWQLTAILTTFSFFLLPFAWVTAVPAAADSLYDPGKSRSMFADRKAHAIGDVVTVLITESTVASQDAQSSDQRSLAAAAGGGSGLFGILKLVPKASLSGNTDHKGSGTTTRNSKLATTMTCTVVAITPAGQLVLKGERSLKVNADTQIIVFHGTARPEDVLPDNTIASGSVADAQIEVLGNGPIDRHVKTGILSRIFQYLF